MTGFQLSDQTRVLDLGGALELESGLALPGPQVRKATCSPGPTTR